MAQIFLFNDIQTEVRLMMETKIYRFKMQMFELKNLWYQYIKEAAIRTSHNGRKFVSKEKPQHNKLENIL